MSYFLNSHTCETMPDNELISRPQFENFYVLIRFNNKSILGYSGGEIVETHLEYCLYCWERLVTQ